MILDLWFFGAGLGLRTAGWEISLCCSGSDQRLDVAVHLVRGDVRAPRGPGIKAWTGVQHFHPTTRCFCLDLYWLNWLAPILVASSICSRSSRSFLARYAALKRRTTAA